MNTHTPAPANATSTITGIRAFHVPMSCRELVPTMQFFVDALGFRIDAIYPADNPGTAILSGHGLTIYLGVGLPRGIEELHLLCDDPGQLPHGARSLTAPNGVLIRLSPADPPMKTPETRQELVLTRADAAASWSVGRAGMRYRDLLPNRHGGAFIASHIRILEGGPVPDYVHFHKVRFQMIFCRKGWVRLVYEAQGDPFILNAGDCVLQPPTIRHRVLESSAGAEVIELGSPAEHITMADHMLALPSPDCDPEREFEGQRFVRHIAANATWLPWKTAGFVASDTGIGTATKGLAGVRVIRTAGESPLTQRIHDTEFCFFFVLSGTLEVHQGEDTYTLSTDDSITLPGNMPYCFGHCSTDLELLEVTLPADFSLQ
jgi:quercetin dioxygenase-like cupin family protein